jgi:hypothetical protein
MKNNQSIHQMYQAEVKKFAEHLIKHKTAYVEYKEITIKNVIMSASKAVFLLYTEAYGNYTTTLSRKGSKFIWTDEEAGIERAFNDMETLRWEYELPQSIISIGNQLV